MLGGGEKLQMLQNYSHGSRRYVKRDALRDSMTSDSPLDSSMSQDSPIKKEPRPIGRKATNAKKGGNSSSNTSKILEEIARQSAIRVEMEQKRQENEMAIRA
ncbi:unnamed protein product [Prunus armeniaca]